MEAISREAGRPPEGGGSSLPASFPPVARGRPRSPPPPRPPGSPPVPAAGEAAAGRGTPGARRDAPLPRPSPAGGAPRARRRRALPRGEEGRAGSRPRGSSPPRRRRRRRRTGRGAPGPPRRRSGGGGRSRTPGAPRERRRRSTSIGRSARDGSRASPVTASVFPRGGYQFGDPPAKHRYHPHPSLPPGNRGEVDAHNSLLDMWLRFPPRPGPGDSDERGTGVA